MAVIPFVSALFIAIAIIFLVVSFLDYIKNGSRMTIARKVWLRLAFIFTAVGCGLYLLRTYLH
jgi:L-cystine uptake protein TcyP (sodium:dicarboxylate symporter family)